MSPSISPGNANGKGNAGGKGNNGSGSVLPDNDTPNAGIPRQKRLACLICRRRKLKCDGRRPSCSTCSRLGHPCAYDEARKKSGPKRGYVKALEDRLKLVEVMLQSQDPAAAASASVGDPLSFSAENNTPAGPAGVARANDNDFNVSDPTLNLPANRDLDRWQFNAESPPRAGSLDDLNSFNSRMPVDMNAVDSNFTWEIINLGLDEPLPPQETIDELTNIYFDKIHPSLPMIHKYRYFAAMNLAPNARPPVCLRYAMWMIACSVSDKYGDLKDLFYQRARKYLEADYMKGYGEHMISVAHCQTHIVLASYEFKMMYFPRAWMSTGQAVRLAQMMGLHRLDGGGLDVKQCLPPARDWTEKEERRRTFWMAFCEDRYASIGTGWPMTVDEQDITTMLPSSEEAFEMSRPEPAISLQEVMCPAGIGQLTPFAGIVLMACLFGRNLIHLHRPDVDDKDDDLNGAFWMRHRNLDNILLNTVLGLPERLKLPNGLPNPNIVFTNMCIYTSTICLHQAAIFKAEKNNLANSVSPESKVRCFSAAEGIAKIMRLVSHMDLSSMNPFISFCLYVAARVFIQYLKSHPGENKVVGDLRFLLTAMSALKRKNPLTESFLVQLDVDLEALGERIPRLKAAFPMSTDSPPSGNTAGIMGRQGANCDDAIDGILSYQREFSKPAEPSTNPSNGQETSEDGSRDRPSASSSAGASVNSGGQRPGQNWLGPESVLPTRDRGSASHSPAFTMSATSAYPDPTASTLLGPSAQTTIQGFVQREGADVHDMSTSPGDGLSNRPTPNSSTASEHRQSLVPPQPGQMRSAGSSFDASPVSPARGLVDARQATTAVDHSAGGYFTTANGTPADLQASNAAAAVTGNHLSGAPGLAGLVATDPASTDFAMPQAWGLPGQTAMTPVSEGVLRTIMQMGPMETMDLGWDSNP